MKLITAAEARKITKENKTKQIENQLKDIMLKIEEATKTGEGKVCWYGWLKDEVIEQLREAGYNVTSYSSMYGDTTVTISWEVEDEN